MLKDAGVVDAGGKGLYFILEGMMRYVNGLPLDVSSVIVQPLSAMKIENTLDNIEPGQDFEVVVDFHPNEELNIAQFYDDLQHIGTSIQLGEGDGMYRMHIHVPAEKLYEPIEYTKSLGTVTKAAIENLRAQMEKIEYESGSPIQCQPVEPGQYCHRCGCSRARYRPGICQPGCISHRRRWTNDESQHAGNTECF